jgi:hypothetical protein
MERRAPRGYTTATRQNRRSGTGRHPRPARAIAAPLQRHFSAAQQGDAGSSPSRASKGKKAMRLPRRIAGLLMAAGMAVGITTVAVPAHADPSYYVIETTTYLDTGGVPLCLEGDPAPDWAYRVTTQPCNVQNNRAQQWEFQSQGGGVIKVANRAISGWCIEANAIANGSAVPLWPCSSTESNLRWVFVDYGIGFGRLESRISGSTGHCLDVPMGQTLPGLWMQVYGCNFTNAQRFFAGLLPA